MAGDEFWRELKPVAQVFRPGALPEASLESLISQVRALDMDEVRNAIAGHEHSHDHGHEHSHDHEHAHEH